MKIRPNKQNTARVVMDLDGAITVFPNGEKLLDSRNWVELGDEDLDEASFDRVRITQAIEDLAAHPEVKFVFDPEFDSALDGNTTFPVDEYVERLEEFLVELNEDESE